MLEPEDRRGGDLSVIVFVFASVESYQVHNIMLLVLLVLVVLNCHDPGVYVPKIFKHDSSVGHRDATMIDHPHRRRTCLSVTSM